MRNPRTAPHPVFAELEQEIIAEGRTQLAQVGGETAAPDLLARLAWEACVRADDVEVPADATDERFGDWISSIADVMAGEAVSAIDAEGRVRLVMGYEPLLSASARLMQSLPDVPPPDAAGAALHELLFDIFIARIEQRLRAG